MTNPLLIVAVIMIGAGSVIALVQRQYALGLIGLGLTLALASRLL